MKSIIIIAVVIGLIFGGVTVASNAMTNRAEGRVEGMLQGWATGGIGAGVEIQEAVSLWFEGVAFIADADKLSGASDDFDAWRREARLYKPIKSFSIDQMVTNKKYLPDEFIAHVTIDGKKYMMMVRSRTQIRWTQQGSFE